LRQEPLDTLERIQDAYISASKEDLHRLANQLLDPKKIQIFVVADKNITVQSSDGRQTTLEQDLKRMARSRDLPFQEIQLRSYRRVTHGVCFFGKLISAVKPT
jgi:hypothetical protein